MFFLLKTFREPSQGFTLVEMMVVVALLSILASAAMPFYQNDRKTGERTRITYCIEAN